MSRLLPRYLELQARVNRAARWDVCPVGSIAAVGVEEDARVISLLKRKDSSQALNSFIAEGTGEDYGKLYLCNEWQKGELRKFTTLKGEAISKGLLGETIAALRHFSVIATQGQILLADLQGVKLQQVPLGS